MTFDQCARLEAATAIVPTYPLRWRCWPSTRCCSADTPWPDAGRLPVIVPLHMLLAATQLQRFELLGAHIHHLLLHLQRAANEQQG